MTFHANFDLEVKELFGEDKFGNDSKLHVEKLDQLLEVDKHLLDCGMTKEYLDNILDVEKYNTVTN